MSSNHACDHWTVVYSFEQNTNVLSYLLILKWNHLCNKLTDPELEDVKRVFVDRFQFVH